MRWVAVVAALAGVVDQAAAAPAAVSIADLDRAAAGCHFVPNADPESRRFAFVIGVANYERPELILKNPVSDAKSVARTLNQIGFDVVVAQDPTGADLLACAAAARDVQARQDRNLTIVYYSGHGVQVDDLNYLVAADLADAAPSDPALQRLDEFVNLFRRTTGSLLTFLDACRDNPFSGVGLAAVGGRTVALGDAIDQATRGLAPASAARGPGSLTSSLFFAYATTPNSVAYDGDGALSPYTQAFVDLVKTPGWSLDRLSTEIKTQVGEATDFAQAPWTRSSLSTQVFLNGELTLDRIRVLSENYVDEARDALNGGDRDAAIELALKALPVGAPEDASEGFDAALDVLVLALHGPYGRIDADLDGELTSVDYSSDRDRVLTYPLDSRLGDGRLSLWSPSDGALVKELALPGADQKLQAYFVGPDDHFVTLEGAPEKRSRLAVASVWSGAGDRLGRLETGCATQERCSISGGVASRREPYFALVTNSCAEIWQVERREALGAICPGAAFDFRKVLFSSDGRRIAFALSSRSSGARTYRFLVYDTETQAQQLEVQVSADRIVSTDLMFSKDGGLLAVKAGSVLKVVGVGSGETLAEHDLQSYSGESLAIVLADGAVVFQEHDDDGMTYVKVHGGGRSAFEAFDFCKGNYALENSVLNSAGYYYLAPEGGASPDCVHEREAWLRENGGRAGQVALGLGSIAPERRARIEADRLRLGY